LPKAITMVEELAGAGSILLGFYFEKGKQAWV
jgi:hypothetical protein